MSIILIRHGETAFNVARVLQPADTPLSERGIAQALGRLLLAIPSDQVREVLARIGIRALAHTLIHECAGRIGQQLVESDCFHEAIFRISRAVVKPVGYMLRRYCPPTSNSAFVICPSEQPRTASISTANTLPFSITAC